MRVYESVVERNEGLFLKEVFFALLAQYRRLQILKHMFILWHKKKKFCLRKCQVFYKLVCLGNVESLQSHCIHTQFHWSSGPPVCFLSWGTQVQTPGGYLCETGILLLVLPCYIHDQDVIDHCGLVWGRLYPKPSLGRHADNVIIPLVSHSSSVPVSRSLQVLFRLHNRHSRLLGGALWRACNLTAFIYSSTGPVVHPFASCHEGPGSIPRGILMWNRDSPVSIVSLK
jgi:hypothetical protein